MTILLETRSDITLEAVRRVAWEGEGVEIAPAALARMDRCHESFQALVAADPEALIYGVTTGPGDQGMARLTEEGRARRPQGLWTAASFGEPLPERVVRAIVLARLANFLEGHAAARGAVGQAVARMLETDLPAVPAQGNGGAGEILALGNLFHGLGEQLRLTPKERMALINGSPCAAALLADVALAARGRTGLAERVFALAVEAVRAPLEAYSADLETLWDEEHEGAALRSLRALLDGHSPDRLASQAPVSFRILPRVLGQVRRAEAEAGRAAATSLRAVTDNPVYVPPDRTHPVGAVFSTGGYHNAWALSAIDRVAFAWADLCQLAQRQTDRLFQHPATAAQLAEEWTYKPLHMVANGWAEEAHLLAQPTLLSSGAFGQNDVGALTFLAWRKAVAIGRCLDAALAVLCLLAAQALRGSGRPVPPALTDLALAVRDALPADGPGGRLGPVCEALTSAFGREVLAGRIAAGAA